MQSSESRCSTPLIVANNPEPADLGTWLNELFQRYGPGEFIVNLAASGRVTVKRPQAPLRFEWESPRDRAG